jgi:hypothetical protein
VILSEAYIRGLYAVWAMYRIDGFYIDHVDKCSDWVFEEWEEDSQECRDFKRGFDDAISGRYSAEEYEESLL